MTKKLGIFEVGTPERSTALDALEFIIKQMRASGLRERTIEDYQMHVKSFIETTDITSINDVTSAHIYEWLGKMEVSNSTKLIRLKCLKAFLNRCLSNGLITSNTWQGVQIKVDREIKRGVSESDITKVISQIDTSTFIGVRDVAALLLLYQTGVRIGTLIQIDESDIDFEKEVLAIGGSKVKNHRSIILPLKADTLQLLRTLIDANKAIRNYYNVSNTKMFINRNGTSISPTARHNTIQRRLRKYAQDFGVEHLNPHSIRRGYAKRLLDKGADLALISKALGHADLSITTNYLHFETQEIVDKLRRY